MNKPKLDTIDIDAAREGRAIVKLRNMRPRTKRKANKR